MQHETVQNVKKKFQQIRDMYKEQVGQKKNNILPLIGVAKDPRLKKESPNAMDHKFRITDIIGKAKKKVNKYEKFHRLYHGETAAKMAKKSPGKKSPRLRVNVKRRFNNSEVRKSPNLTIREEIRQKLDDPYWKKQLKIADKPSINRHYFLQSTQDDTSQPSQSPSQTMISGNPLPFELKFDSHKFYAMPTPKKHT